MIQFSAGQILFLPDNIKHAFFNRVLCLSF
jgi:hypothetical protein